MLASEAREVVVSRRGVSILDGASMAVITLACCAGLDIIASSWSGTQSLPVGWILTLGGAVVLTTILAVLVGPLRVEPRNLLRDLRTD